jgi:DNA-binding MarR family transcriptional regulator
MKPHAEIRDLIDRLSRIYAAGQRSDELNPTQLAALFYLSRANEFSRAPSQVADYLAATRGTVSQTLKTLLRKGFIAEIASATDRRRITYDLTPLGEKMVSSFSGNEAIKTLDEPTASRIADALKVLVRTLLRSRGDRSFGVCRTCRHHQTDADGARCALLEVRLRPGEMERICYEHEIAA